MQICVCIIIIYLYVKIQVLLSMSVHITGWDHLEYLYHYRQFNIVGPPHNLSRLSLGTIFLKWARNKYFTRIFVNKRKRFLHFYVR